jgi:hypothetical protein
MPTKSPPPGDFFAPVAAPERHLRSDGTPSIIIYMHSTVRRSDRLVTTAELKGKSQKEKGKSDVSACGGRFAIFSFWL